MTRQHTFSMSLELAGMILTGEAEQLRIPGVRFVSLKVNCRTLDLTVEGQEIPTHATQPVFCRDERGEVQFKHWETDGT